MKRILSLALLALLSIASVAHAQVATNLVFDTNVAPFIPPASAAHPGTGWTDAQGTTWTTNSSSAIVAGGAALAPASLLSRPGSGAGTSAVTPGVQENSLNQRMKLTFTLASLSTSNSPTIVLRSNNNASSLNAYELLIGANVGTVRAFSVTGGTATSIFTSTTTTFVVGHSYQMDFECDQTNSTTTTCFITFKDLTAGTTFINNQSITRTSTQDPALQNPAFSGAALNATSNGFPQVVTQVQYFTDQAVNTAVAATGYTVTLPSTGIVGQAQSGTVAITGGTTLGSALSVALTSSGSSTISPNPVTIANGATSASVSYTPTAAGSDVLAWTYSGGNASMTGNGGQTNTITATSVIPVTDPNLYLSGGWYLNGGGAYANNAGQYVQMAFTGASLSVAFDVSNLITSSVTAAEWPVIRYTVDSGNPVDLLLATQGGNTYTLNLTSALSGASTHTLRIVLRSETQAFARWVPNATGYPPAGLRLLNFTLASGASTVPLSGTALQLRSHYLISKGDSITEGSKTSWPNPTVTSDSEATWGNALASCLGAEYSNEAFSGQAYSGQLGVPDVPHFGSAWNMRFSGVSRLSGGLFVPAPDYIAVNMGTNDAANSASKTAGSVSSVITSIRAAAPNAYIFLLYPFAFHQPYWSTQGYGAFLASEYANVVANDNKAFVIDLGAAAGTGLPNYPAGSSNSVSADGLHPDGQKSTNLGGVACASILAAMPVAANTNVPQFQNRFFH